MEEEKRRKALESKMWAQESKLSDWSEWDTDCEVLIKANSEQNDSHFVIPRWKPQVRRA